MAKKKVCLIGNTESTCSYITHQLISFLDPYIEVVTWCISQMQSPPSNLKAVDLFIFSNQTVFDTVSQFLPEGKPVLVADRIINTEYLDKLFELEPKTRALVVGTTSETVHNTIDILYSLGFRDFDLVPYFPGIMGGATEEIEIAITTGLSYLAPRQVKTVIDLGGKGLDLSTFAQLLRQLDVPMKVLNDISHYYLQAILQATSRIKNIGKQNEILKQRLAVILDTVDEAIIAIDSNNRILLFNPAAENLLKIPNHIASGNALGEVLPDVDFSDCLHSGQPIRHRICSINNQYFVVNANTIMEQAGKISGIVATLRPVQEVQELDTKVRRILKQRGNVAKYVFRDLVGRSAELTRVLALAKRFAQTELTVLLEGESGTGKELFAQSLHNASPRRDGPFVAVNFAAIPENLIESELFGYENGAFTGARRGGKPGLFEEAHLGTIFLDEISSASLDVQKRLLRVLEEKEVRRLGAGDVTPVDVRVVAATNQELDELVRQGKFRRDLFYRLCALPIIIPPLRCRQDDILLLVDYFANKYYQRELHLGEQMTEFFLRYEWPGNVRELQNVVQYLCNLVGAGQRAEIRHLPQYLTRNSPPNGGSEGSGQEFTYQTETIPAEFQSPDAARLLARLLTELSHASQAGKGIGWQHLLKAMEDLPVSENIIKRWLRNLAKKGFVKTGVTRQGTRLTERGTQLLNSLTAFQ